ncbi:MAG: tetratricopeptide repeat protein [SAR324 cluster bacterium]|nr:tetratricopeptide repeat protein [SAR324 cluster bacterium]MBL7035279.1 tetratricopeptide repeat protein [SAR324 cluster bacterium]
MWFYRSFLVLLTLSCLTAVGVMAQTAELLKPVIIQNVELLHRGKQTSVRLLTDKPPVFEITENLAAQTLVIKFKNAHAVFTDGRMERLFNDAELAGIRFLEIGDDSWAQFKLQKTDLSYSVSILENQAGVQIDFRPAFQINPQPDPPEDAVYKLTSLKFETRNINFTRLIFSFEKPEKTSAIGEVSEDKQPPRIFLLEDSRQAQLTIRLPNTLPAEELEKLKYLGKRVELKALSSEVNQTFIELKLNVADLRVERHFVSSPLKWMLDVYGTIDQKSAAVADVDGVKLTPEEISAVETEKKARRIRASKINPILQLGETAFRKGFYDEAVSHFKEAYALGKEHTKEEFGDPLHPLAARALFRIGDTIYTMLERRIGDNYHKAIDSYKTAIRITQDAEKIATENGGNFEATSLLPHANFRIGRAYQKMKFQHEAAVYYKILQERFPNSVEAMEASFWKGMSRIDRRQWEIGITDFKEYLRSSAQPKFYAVAHYKMAQAYYQLERYITAKEFFDIARSADDNYVKDDPTLLFHMGETYYENADYVTAREIFRILLQKYPKADFSKLVALRLGDFLRDEGKESEAIQAYKNAISSYTREIALLGKLRIANIQAKRPYTDEYLEALKVYAEIPRLYPETPQAEEALLREGLTLTLYGSYAPAIKSLESFMEKYPQNIYVRRNVIQENIDENLKGLIDKFFRKDDTLALVSAYSDYKTKYLFNFRFNTTLFQTAVAHRKLGFYDEALDILHFLETRSAGTVGELVQLEKAQTLLEKGDLTEARNTAALFLQKYPASPYDAEARQLLARIYRQQKSYPKALLVYRQTLQKYDQNKQPLLAEIAPELYYDLGELHEETGNFIESGEAFQQVIESYNHPVDHQDTPEYIIKSHFMAADMFNKAKNYPTALESYQLAISLYANNKNKEIIERIFWARYQTGTIFSRQQKFKQALSIFKNLMETETKDSPLWKKLAAENYRSISNKQSYNEYLKE